MSTDVIKEILAYIDDHICEKLSLAELAEIAGYSPFYFSKLFSEIMGMSITGYIRIRKLQYALGSLLEGRKVLDVSLMYAFDSHEGFTRSFARLFGSTPSKVRKYLTSYQVPEYCVPSMERRTHMVLDKKNLLENTHQIIYEVLRTSLEEAKAGYCTEINVTLFQDGSVKIADNGRGIPLSQNTNKNQQVLDKILSGHPISNLEYAQMGDFSQCSLQTVNSLCESLQINVFRNGKCFSQDYVRGIAQHNVLWGELEHPSGTEIILKPDSMIFGDMTFSIEMIKEWVDENVGKENTVVIKLNEDFLLDKPSS